MRRSFTLRLTKPSERTPSATLLLQAFLDYDFDPITLVGTHSSPALCFKRLQYFKPAPIPPSGRQTVPLFQQQHSLLRSSDRIFLRRDILSWEHVTVEGLEPRWTGHTCRCLLHTSSLHPQILNRILWRQIAKSSTNILLGHNPHRPA